MHPARRNGGQQSPAGRRWPPGARASDPHPHGHDHRQPTRFPPSLGIQDPRRLRGQLARVHGPRARVARRRLARSSPPSRWRRALSTRRSSRRLTRRSRAGAPCQGRSAARSSAHGQRHARTQGRPRPLDPLEMGKIVQEGWGEVQECIDIADFAVGLSASSTADHALGATRPRHARAVASPRHRRGPDGVQFPDGGLGVEFDARLHLRRCVCLEAQPEDPAHGHRPHQRGASDPRGGGLRRPRWSCDRRERGRGVHDDGRRPPPADLVHRLDGHRQARGWPRPAMGFDPGCAGTTVSW